MKQHKKHKQIKVRLLSMLTALTMLTALFPPMTSYAALSTVQLYYTNGDAVIHNYSIALRSFFVVYSEDHASRVNSVTSADSTIATCSSAGIKEIGGKKYCEFSIVPRKVGTTTITLTITRYPYGFQYENVKESRSQEIPITVEECPNHNVVQGEITDSYNARSCSACKFYKEKQHTYNEQHICTVCNHQCTHSSTDWTTDENGHSKKCVDCKAELQSYTAHTYTNGSNIRHTCSECGYSAKHTYDENHICTVCKHKCTHNSKNVYETSTGHYTVCPDCGRRTDTEPHTYKQKTGDKTYHYCSVCNYSQNHSFGAWHVAGDIRKRDCSICGYADTGEYTKPIHDKPHNICCDDTCTEHEEFSWWVVPLADNLVNVGGKKNQCLVPAAFKLSTVWEFPDFVATLSGDNKNKVDNCLYANTLTLSNGAYINIKNGQTYSLTDCYKGLGTVTGGTNGVIKIENGGAFSLFEGTITGNSGSSGIIENSGTTNIYGGTITGNTGTVIKNSGTLNIYSGAITNNTGAAIENSGTVNIYGGTITNNAGGGIIGTGTINFKEGNPVIESNTVDNVICNVKGANTITVTALGEDASIGFTPATAVTAGNPKEISANGGEYYSHFVSDNGDYAIIQSGSKIQLIAAHSVLEHHAAKAATCTEGGNDEYWSCADCNRLYSDKDGNTEIYAIPTTDATGHSWGGWRIATEPTFTTTGTAERACENNPNHTENVELPVLTDTTFWEEGDYTAPTETTDGSQAYTSEYGSVTVVLPATGPGSFSVRYEGGKAIVTASKAGTCAVLFAAYDAGGRLTSLSFQTVSVEKGETTVTPENFTANGTVKVMLWENLASIKPLCGTGGN